MNLTLGPEDLRDDRKDTPTSATTFDDFKPEVQKAIAAVGLAIYHNRQSYNAIHPPIMTQEKATRIDE